MKILPLFIVVILISACSSSYTPDEEMLALKKNMSIEQAMQVVQTAISDTENLKGICGSRGFWYDENSNMIVQQTGIAILAHKRGKILRSSNKGFGDTTIYEKQYYKYNFDFNKISSINIYKNPALLPTFPTCNKKDLKENYLVIDLHGDELTNLKFIVSESDFSKTMAAITLLLPDTVIKNK